MANYDEIMSKSIEKVEEFIQSYGVKYSLEELCKFTGSYVNHLKVKNQLQIVGMKDKKKIQMFGFKRMQTENVTLYKEEAEVFLKYLEIIKLLQKAEENFEKLN